MNRRIDINDIITTTFDDSETCVDCACAQRSDDLSKGFSCGVQDGVNLVTDCPFIKLIEEDLDALNFGRYRATPVDKSLLDQVVAVALGGETAEDLDLSEGLDYPTWSRLLTTDAPLFREPLTAVFESRIADGAYQGRLKGVMG